MTITRNYILVKNYHLHKYVVRTYKIYSVEKDEYVETLKVVSMPTQNVRVKRKEVSGYFLAGLKKLPCLSGFNICEVGDAYLSAILNKNDAYIGDRILRSFYEDYPEYKV